MHRVTQLLPLLTLFCGTYAHLGSQEDVLVTTTITQTRYTCPCSDLTSIYTSDGFKNVGNVTAGATGTGSKGEQLPTIAHGFNSTATSIVSDPTRATTVNVIKDSPFTNTTSGHVPSTLTTEGLTSNTTTAVNIQVSNPTTATAIDAPSTTESNPNLYQSFSNSTTTSSNMPTAATSTSLSPTTVIVTIPTTVPQTTADPFYTNATMSASPTTSTQADLTTTYTTALPQTTMANSTTTSSFIEAISDTTVKSTVILTSSTIAINSTASTVTSGTLSTTALSSSTTTSTIVPNPTFTALASGSGTSADGTRLGGVNADRNAIIVGLEASNVDYEFSIDLATGILYQSRYPLCAEYVRFVKASKKPQDPALFYNCLDGPNPGTDSYVTCGISAGTLNCALNATVFGQTWNTLQIRPNSGAYNVYLGSVLNPNYSPISLTVG